MRDAVREHARLAGSGAGDDENRALGGQDGLALGRIQVGEVLLGRGDGHAPILAPRLAVPEEQGRLRRVPGEPERGEAVASLLDKPLVLPDDAERAKREGLEVGVRPQKTCGLLLRPLAVADRREARPGA